MRTNVALKLHRNGNKTKLNAKKTENAISNWISYVNWCCILVHIKHTHSHAYDAPSISTMHSAVLSFPKATLLLCIAIRARTLRIAIIINFTSTFHFAISRTSNEKWRNAERMRERRMNGIASLTIQFVRVTEQWQCKQSTKWCGDEQWHNTAQIIYLSFHVTILCIVRALSLLLLTRCSRCAPIERTNYTKKHFCVWQLALFRPSFYSSAARTNISIDSISKSNKVKQTHWTLEFKVRIKNRLL